MENRLVFRNVEGMGGDENRDGFSETSWPVVDRVGNRIDHGRGIGGNPNDVKRQIDGTASRKHGPRTRKVPSLIRGWVDYRGLGKPAKPKSRPAATASPNGAPLRDTDLRVVVDAIIADIVAARAEQQPVVPDPEIFEQGF